MYVCLHYDVDETKTAEIKFETHETSLVWGRHKQCYYK